jgi:hypothetical protein
MYSETQSAPLDKEVKLESENTKQLKLIVVGCTACITAIFATQALIASPTWPMAMGVVAISIMATTVCCFIFRKESK